MRSGSARREAFASTIRPGSDVTDVRSVPWQGSFGRNLPGGYRVAVGGPGHDGAMSTIESVRALALSLPRSYEALVRDRVKFRVGRIVFLAFSRDEKIMGFAFPKEEREALVASDPRRFLMPGTADLRYNWVEVRLDTI